MRTPSLSGTFLSRRFAKISTLLILYHYEPVFVLVASFLFYALFQLLHQTIYILVVKNE